MTYDPTTGNPRPVTSAEMAADLARTSAGFANPASSTTAADLINPITRKPIASSAALEEQMRAASADRRLDAQGTTGVERMER